MYLFLLANKIIYGFFYSKNIYMWVLEVNPYDRGKMKYLLKIICQQKQTRDDQF